MYSLVETSKANKADVRIYLQYLLECIFSKENEGYVREAEFLESLMPWPETYRQYEENVRSDAVNTFRKLFRDTEPPPLYGWGEMKLFEDGSGRENSPSDNVA